MSQLSYGIEKPEDMLEKLKFDASKLTETPHPFDLFNFVVSAAVLNEWMSQCYKQHPTVQEIMAAKAKREYGMLPAITQTWIPDQSCLPNPYCDVRRHIMNAMCICWETANASKHYHWFSTSNVRAIEPEPIVGDFYQYFFTSCEPDVYIDYDGECYGVSQLRGIVVQFYEALLSHVQPESDGASFEA